MNLLENGKRKFGELNFIVRLTSLSNVRKDKEMEMNRAYGSQKFQKGWEKKISFNNKDS